VQFRFTGKLDKLTLTINQPQLTPEHVKKLMDRLAREYRRKPGGVSARVGPWDRMLLTRDHCETERAGVHWRHHRQIRREVIPPPSRPDRARPTDRASPQQSLLCPRRREILFNPASMRSQRLRFERTKLPIGSRSLLWTTRSSRINPRLFVIPIESAGTAGTGWSIRTLQVTAVFCARYLPLEIPVEV